MVIVHRWRKYWYGLIQWNSSFVIPIIGEETVGIRASTWLFYLLHDRSRRIASET